MFIYVIVSLYQIIILLFDFVCVYVCMCSLYVSLFVRLCVCICVRTYVVRMTLVTSINILSVVDKHVRSYICPCHFDLLHNAFG